VQELGTYLKKKVTIDSNNQQTPKTRNLTTDEGEFVFISGVENKRTNEISIADNQIQKDFIQSSDLKFNRDSYNSFFASLHSPFGLMIEDDRFINPKQAISFSIAISPSSSHVYGLDNTAPILLTVSPSFSIKNYLGESGDIYWHYGLGLNLLTEFKEIHNNFYGFEALIGWGQIGFNKKSILFGLPLRSLKISTGYQILFIPGESQNVSETFVDRGIELKVAIGYSHKRSYSEGVKIYQD